ncbi:MAG: UbiX family flavin prenyltransferase [Candidatus Schekmanbacteria bacterium]|nr:UbiX family flavin prenyltransferase [Candidatus Schekmanbacteria bacterium]
MQKKKLIVALTGASGATYAVRLINYLAGRKDIEVSLIVSDTARMVVPHETDLTAEMLSKKCKMTFPFNDLSAPLASGSFKRDGMIVIPCTIKTMSSIAYSLSNNLIVRAADVNLKEKKPLVLCVRETPLHVGHLKTMTRLAEMGAVIMPLSPSFYHRPKTIDEIVDFTVGRALDLMGIENELSHPYEGIKQK